MLTRGWIGQGSITANGSTATASECVAARVVTPPRLRVGARDRRDAAGRTDPRPRSRRTRVENVRVGGAAPPAEVADVVIHLRAKTGARYSAAIPLQEEDDLAFGQEIAAPSVRNRSELVSFLIGTPAAAFADPVVETLIRERGARPR